MKRKNKILITVVAVLLAISFTYLWFENFVIYSTEEVDMHLKVTEGYMVGVNTRTDALYFGKVRKGGLSTRKIILDNYDENPHFVQIRTFGDLSKWVYVSDNNFVLPSNESKNVSVSCDVPIDADVGNYTGKLQVVYFNI
ncbi:MAG: hypothetical protein GTN38_04845 [Candidatus Aenigmarchaeota archaeon]|nr:hypothetical protein [Candidatus Aenigmarchaeota archaeon]NIP41073.1 hypothetical protein [Candidatus Aenigmarchaeota archaeon]NIQ17475.1 hypothetical protein [Candidatus Aenigmarchaeota archaeon]NIS73669.1 hypothetical protein [Candidatus Aenigmarchaeota archaeon]